MDLNAETRSSLLLQQKKDDSKLDGKKVKGSVNTLVELGETRCFCEMLGGSKICLLHESASHYLALALGTLRLPSPPSLHLPRDPLLCIPRA